LGGADRGKKGSRGKAGHRGVAKATVTDRELGNGVSTVLEGRVVTRIGVIKALEDKQARLFDHGVEDVGSVDEEAGGRDTGMIVKRAGPNLAKEAHSSMGVVGNSG
jgi:hypothetical protein